MKESEGRFGGPPGVGEEDQEKGGNDCDEPSGDAFEGIGRGAVEEVTEEMIKRPHIYTYRTERCGPA